MPRLAPVSLMPRPWIRPPTSPRPTRALDTRSILASVPHRNIVTLFDSSLTWSLIHPFLDDLIVDTGSSNTWVGANKPYTKTNTSVKTDDSVVSVMSHG